jgi:uncharacterized protein (TIGR02246 family)
MTETTDTPTDTDTDLDAIRQIVQDVQDGFNTNDPELMVKHFTEDAWILNPFGQRTVGRDAILDFSRTALEGFLKDEFAAYEVRDVQFVHPDLALAFKEAWATDAEGARFRATPDMASIYTLVREGGTWRIAARANVATPPA